MNIEIRFNMSLLNRLNKGLVNSATIDQLMELLNEWDLENAKTR